MSTAGAGGAGGHRGKQDGGDLAGVLKLMDHLERQVEALTQEVKTINQATRMKEEEVRKLTKKLENMKDGSRRPKVQAMLPPMQVGKSAVSILPEEVWRMIIGLVTDPKDLWNISNTCQLFETILRQWKNARAMELAFPHFYDHLYQEDILNCRLVTKGMNMAVDSFLEEHPSLRPYDEQLDLQRLEYVSAMKQHRLNLSNVFIFCNGDEDNSGFVNDPEFPLMEGRTSFIGRQVCVKMGRRGRFQQQDQPEDEWWGRLAQFMDVFGHEIWYFTLILPDFPNRAVRRVLQELLVSRLLHYLPNLRALTIDFRQTSLVYGENRPLPRISKLETVQILNYPTTATWDYFLHSLVALYGMGNLKKLYLDINTCSMIRGMYLHSIRELSIEVGKAERSIDQELNDLHPYWRYDVTKINLIFPNQPKRLLFEDLLSFINTFTDETKLISIRLEGCLVGVRFGTAQELAYRAPYRWHNSRPSIIKTLEVDIDWVLNTYPVHLNFGFLLRCFPYLENLVLFARATHGSAGPDLGTAVDLLSKPRFEEWAERTWSCMEEQYEFIEIHKYLFGNRMYKSNIWELMPRLKLLMVQRDSYTREGYEAYKRRG